MSYTDEQNIELNTQPISAHGRSGATNFRHLSRGSFGIDQIDVSAGNRVLADCRSKVRGRQAQIAKLIAQGRIRPAEREARNLRTCFAARMVAAERALTPKKNQAPTTERITGEARFAAIWQTAEQLKGFSRPAQPFAYKEPKARGGYRNVFNFDLLDQARSHLMAIAIHPFASFHPSQFTLQHGRSVACEKLLQALNGSSQEVRFVQVDIVDFYGSISHQWLEEHMPLPRADVRHYLHTGGMTIRTSRGGNARRFTDEDREEAGRRGIPAGSAVSPLIAEWVMSDVLTRLADHLQDVTLFTYSDNIGMVLTPSIDTTVFEELVRHAFKTHPAGPFQLSISVAEPDKEAFRFLGYSWQREGEGWTASVPEKVWSDRALSWTNDASLATFDGLYKIEQKVRGYCSAFNLWAGAVALRETVLQQIDSLRIGWLRELINSEEPSTSSSLRDQLSVVEHRHRGRLGHMDVYNRLLHSGPGCR